MCRSSICQKVLQQRPWLVSLGSTMNVPHVSLTKIIQSEEGNQASQSDLKLNIVQGWPPLSSIQLDCFFLHNFTSSHHSAGPFCHHHHLQRHPHTKPLPVVSLSFHAVSPDTEFSLSFLGYSLRHCLHQAGISTFAWSPDRMKPWHSCWGNGF